MTDWDGNINSPHTMQDEYELARELGVDIWSLTTDDDGQMIAAPDDGPGICPLCHSFVADVEDHIEYLRNTGDPEHQR